MCLKSTFIVGCDQSSRSRNPEENVISVVHNPGYRQPQEIYPVITNGCVDNPYVAEYAEEQRCSPMSTSSDIMSTLSELLSPAYNSWGQHQQTAHNNYVSAYYPQSMDLPGLGQNFSGGDLGDFKFSVSPATSVSDNGQLPQLCKVCGDTSSGNHFGVMSCEACKSFFRRSVRSNSRYACRNSRNCTIEKHTRNRCQYCRFQKCAQMGMRKEAVQEERTPQVTKLQPQIANTPTQLGFHPYSLPLPPPMFKPYESPTSPLPSILSQNNRLFGSLPNLKMQFGSDLPRGNSLSNLLPSTSDVFPSHFTPTSTVAEPSADPNMCPQASPSAQVNASVLLNADIQADQPPEQVTFSERGIKLEDIFEGARQSLLKMIEWGKRIPAFTALNLDDQVKLLKRSWCENVLLKLCTRMGPRSDTMMLSSGLTCRRDQIDDPEVRRVVENLNYEVAYWLDILNVDRVEMACLKGIILFNPDAKGLSPSARKRVEIFQDQILSALENRCKTLYPVTPQRFAKLILRLAPLRTSALEATQHMEVQRTLGNAKIDNIFGELLDFD